MRQAEAVIEFLLESSSEKKTSSEWNSLIKYIELIWNKTEACGTAGDWKVLRNGLAANVCPSAGSGYFIVRQMK